MTRPLLLVVDDDECTRAALATLFSGQGWRVALAGTLAEGMAQLDPAPRCVILDLNLPDGDGETLLHEIRLRLPGTRVAVCSALNDGPRLDRVARLKPELMLWKPIDLAPLFRLCQRAMAASA